MLAIAFLQRRPVEAAWVAFAAASVAAMVVWPTWETIPFHFVWISLTIVYGFRVWGPSGTTAALGAVIVVTGAAILTDAFNGIQLWGELFEVPLMSAMFLAMVWHARRRQEALRVAKHEAAQRATLLDRQERFLHDASHELRTPVTIARGHLEIAVREGHGAGAEISVALDELGRIEGIVERLLLLAKIGQPDFIVTVDIDAEGFLEDVFMRWSEVAACAWRLGRLATGTLRADPDALRNALDALLENAVRYTNVGGAIELRSRARANELTIEVVDGGPGIPPDALSRIFDRFARGDAARTRAEGGVGLGLAIVDAIALAHGGSCTVSTSSAGSVFSLNVPGFVARQEHVPGTTEPLTSGGHVPALMAPRSAEASTNHGLLSRSHARADLAHGVEAEAQPSKLDT